MQGLVCFLLGVTVVHKVCPLSLLAWLWFTLVIALARRWICMAVWAFCLLQPKAVRHTQDQILKPDALQNPETPMEKPGGSLAHHRGPAERGVR